MDRRRTRPLARALAAAVLALVSLGVPNAAMADVTDPADPAPSTLQRLESADLAATVKLSNCSGALVRFPTSRDTDRAMMLTNGHCAEGRRLGAGDVYVDRASNRRGTLLGASGQPLGRVRADRLLYATMSGTDVALYRLTTTFAAVTHQYAVSALTISDRHPVAGSSISIPTSYFATVYSCRIDGFVPTLREARWTWHDSIRYEFPDDDCHTIHGTSGSPVIDDASLEVVGINNTGNDDGAACTLDNPCEVADDGTVSETKGQNYGQQTYAFTTCLTPANAIDLDRPGCGLAHP